MDPPIHPLTTAHTATTTTELELDEILHARSRLNEMIRKAIQDACTAWGMEVGRSPCA